MKTLTYLFNLGAMAVLLIAGTSVTHAGSVAYTYDAAGRIVAADYGAGQSLSYAYDNAGNLLQTSQPSLGLVLSPISGGQFVLFWPAQPAGFILEASPTLGPSAVWTTANATLTLAGDRVMATIPITGTIQFYRLRKP